MFQLILLTICVFCRQTEAKYAAGTGEPNDPYQITTAEELMLLGDSPEDYDKHFILIADIDLDPNLPGRKVFDKAVIAPDTYDLWAEFKGIPFTGVFDGNGFEIQNMTIECDEDHPNRYVGLFEEIDETSIVRSLKLVNASVHSVHYESIGTLAGANKGRIIGCSSTECDADDGGLVGENHGDIVDCHSSGSVSGSGGLVGENDGNVIDCTSSCDVEGYKDVGGLVGINRGTIESSHASGSVEGTESIGGLVGYERSGTIHDCYATGNVTGRDKCKYVGGLVGHNQGDMIYMSYALGDVTGGNDSIDIGGLVGMHNGDDIVSCYASGNVEGTRGVGGLAGNNRGDIDCCYATGYAKGENGYFGEFIPSHAGGLVGLNGGGIVNSYARGTVGGERSSGGLVGENRYGQINNCYATGKISLRNWPYLDLGGLGGLVGLNAFGSIEQCYHLDQNYYRSADSSPLPDDIGDSLNNGLGEPLTAVQMKMKNSFESWDFFDNKKDGLEDHWCLREGDYPVLSWQTEITGLKRIPDVEGLFLEEALTNIINEGFIINDSTQTDFHEFIPKGDSVYTIPTGYSPVETPVNVIISDGPYEWTTNDGDGSEDNPYIITTSGQLEAIGASPDILISHFMLANDIDMHSKEYSQPIVFEFMGKLDGYGHRVSNFNIKPQRDNLSLGFFYALGREAEIQNLHIENAFIWAEGSVAYSAGLLAADSEGTVMNCHSSGMIYARYGTWYVGGLVGKNEGYISNCSANVQIKGVDYVGGLVGQNKSSIAMSFSIGAVAGNDNIGGLVGGNANGSITDCYSASRISGHDAVGGLVGQNSYSTSGGGRTRSVSKYFSGSITSSYSIGTITGILSGGLVGNNGGSVSDCFWDVQTSGISEINLEWERGTGLETFEMQQASTFLEAGWDFVDEDDNGTEDIWWILEGQGYPRLSWEAHD